MWLQIQTLKHLYKQQWTFLISDLYMPLLSSKSFWQNINKLLRSKKPKKNAWDLERKVLKTNKSKVSVVYRTKGKCEFSHNMLRSFQWKQEQTLLGVLIIANSIKMAIRSWSKRLRAVILAGYRVLILLKRHCMTFQVYSKELAQ